MGFEWPSALGTRRSWERGSGELFGPGMARGASVASLQIRFAAPRRRPDTRQMDRMTERIITSSMIGLFIGVVAAAMVADSGGGRSMDEYWKGPLAGGVGLVGGMFLALLVMTFLDRRRR